MAILTKFASAFTLTTGFNDNFTNPQNAYATDGAFATNTDSKPRNREFATNWRGFDFSAVPTGSIITAAIVYVQVKISSANTSGEWRSSVWEDVTVAAAIAPGVTGSIGNIQEVSPTTSTSLNNWSYSMSTVPTLAQLKAANFGVRVQAAQGNNGTTYTYSIDSVSIYIEYTPPNNPILGISNGIATTVSVISSKSAISGNTDNKTVAPGNEDTSVITGSNQIYDSYLAGQQINNWTDGIISQFQFYIRRPTGSTSDTTLTATIRGPGTATILATTTISTAGIPNDNQYQWVTFNFTPIFISAKTFLYLIVQNTGNISTAVAIGRGPDKLPTEYSIAAAPSWSNNAQDSFYRITHSILPVSVTTSGVLTNYVPAGPIQGVINGATTVSADHLHAKINIASTVNASATIVGVLTFIQTIELITGTINGFATVQCTLIGKGNLSGAIQTSGFEREQQNIYSYIVTSLSDNNRYVGVKFDNFNDIIYDCSFKLWKETAPSPAGTATAEIWSVDGNSVPDTLLESSNNSISTDNIISGSWNWYNFNFDGNSYQGKIAIIVRVQHPSTGVVRLGFYFNNDLNLPNENLVYRGSGGGSWINSINYEGTYILNYAFDLVTGVLTESTTMYGQSDGITSTTGSMLAKISIEGSSYPLVGEAVEHLGYDNNWTVNGNIVALAQSIFSFNNFVQKFTCWLRSSDTPLPSVPMS